MISKNTESTSKAGQTSVQMDRAKHSIAAHFGLKVTKYHDHAIVQRELLSRVLPYYLEKRKKNALWADIGCGDGSLEHFPEVQVGTCPGLGIDISFQSVAFCSRSVCRNTRWLCADMENPPLRPATLDGIVAASVLQWASSFPEVITTFSDLLKQNGIFIFSLFSEGSFSELYSVRKYFEMPLPILLPSIDTIHDLFNRNGFTETEVHPFTHTLFFNSAYDVLRHFSAIGSTASFTSSLTRTRLKEICHYYETHFGTGNGIPITYRAYYGFTRKGGVHA